MTVGRPQASRDHTPGHVRGTSDSRGRSIKTQGGKAASAYTQIVWFTHVETGFFENTCMRADTRLRIPDSSWLRAASGRSSERFCVTELNMAGSDNAAGCQHVQHGSFLSFLFTLHSTQLHVLDQGSEDVHCVFLLCREATEVF